jgi:hypothetical protein
MKVFDGKFEQTCSGRYRFVGESTRQYADTLCEEMGRRRIKFAPIDWHQ